MTETAPLVDAVEVLRLVGSAAFERGREYFRAGAVLDTTWNDTARTLTATVRGSTDNPYQCVIDLSPERSKVWPVSSWCDCPLQADCKHVVAALLQSNAQAAGAIASPIEQPKPASWKDTVGALSGKSVASAAQQTQLGLLFELREQIKRSRSRWNAPVAKAALAPLDETATYRLGVRPVTLSPSGSWIRSGVTWNSISYQANRLALSLEQQRWFSQFAALHRATRFTTTQEPDWLYLDDFESPLLWSVLADAANSAIHFVSGKKQTDVTVAHDASISMDVAKTPAGLVLSPALTIDDVQVPATFSGTVGDHGIYTFGLEPSPHVTLAPTRMPITTEQRALLGSQPLTVPAAEVDEFLGDYYPTLTRVVTVTSNDESVLFPEVAPPVIVLTVAFAPKHQLHLTWQWEFGGERSPLAFGQVPDEVERVLKASPRNMTIQGIDAAEFIAHMVPALQETTQVKVEFTGKKLSYTELTDTPHLMVKTVETHKRDWFDLGIVITVEGRDVPFAKVFAALSKGQTKLMLVDNSYLSLEQPIFDNLRSLINEAEALAEWDTGKPLISRYQASFWEELEEIADDTEQAVAWRAAVSGLTATFQPTPLPPGLLAELRPYQQDGFDWLAYLYKHQLGGVLADDMGLGKTLQALALIQHTVTASLSVTEPVAVTEPLPVTEPVEVTTRAKSASTGSATGRHPFLVVAPTSVVSNWAAEAARFAPGLRVHAVTTSKQKIPADVDLVVTSYGLFRLDYPTYAGRSWAGMILDEAQFVKNRQSKAHELAADIDIPFKLAITGTPMENSLMDLWSMFHITAPGLFPSATRFIEQYEKPIANGNSEVLGRLRRRIRPLMMRRTKELVASDLPPKQEQVLYVDLAPAHRKLYDTVLQKERQKLLGLIDDLDKNRFIVFRSLTLLRMLSLDATLVNDEHEDIPSSKLDVLMQQVEDVVAEGHRALIFSQFTSYLSLVRERLTEEGVQTSYLDGSTRRRGEVIEAFKTGDAPVFLISLKAGGFGLNLTEADYVFLLDPWWNPATETQAIDRTHRIGQAKNVMVYRLVARDTIEEKVMALAAAKAQLFDSVMDDDAVFSTALTADDIRGLLD